MTTTHSIRTGVRGASWLEIRGIQGLDPFDRLDLARTLARAGGKPVVEERPIRDLVSLVLPGATAIVSEDAIAILGCADARLDRAASYALAIDPGCSVRYVRFLGPADDRAQIDPTMSSLAAIRNGVVTSGSSFVAYACGRGFSSVSHLRVRLGEDRADRFYADPADEVRALATYAGLEAPLVHDHGFESFGHATSLFAQGEMLVVHVRPEPDVREASVLVRDASDARAAAIGAALERWADGVVEHTRVEGDDRRRAAG